jgi:4-hydroxy-tetrahydrodipicolinate reductase
MNIAPLSLAIVGYGKMGRIIERIATERGHTVSLKLDEFNNAGHSAITPQNFKGVDVAIDFSVPEAAVENMFRISALGVNVVEGTTGWLPRIDEVRAAIKRNDTGLVWSPNYSIGVQIFSRAVALAARLMAGEPEYEAWAWEIHHSAKKDAPSGTLLKLVADMKAAGYNRPVDTSSNRAGKIAGTHEIGFDSAADTITLRHTARSREGFALGAVKAAEWLSGKKGFHEFAEILF